MPWLSEQSVQKAASVMAAAMATITVTSAMSTAMTIIAMSAVPGAWLRITGPGGHTTPNLRRCASLEGGVPFDDLVEFASIEPNPPALRTIIDFDALPIGKQEVDPAHRTEHALRPFPG